ncbi:MAG: hypothetical protein M2R45_02684 [Verrucomicrobia subdivision 3 bacterium]|nr:hypothetical protein [Limisphaerales bacterium]MCS1414060.1 hypothetical protein [Limisphaerales bacterium]
MSEAELLIIFLKVPLPGFVKTRLADRLGAEAACEAYRTLVQDLLDNLDGYRQVELRISPDDTMNQLIEDWLRPGWVCRGQGDGDLGQRLTGAFEAAFSSGRRKVIAIGSDCPYVTLSQVATAFERLDIASVVLGPTVDGGYWLMGMNRFILSLFRGISWSSEKVLSQTLERVQTEGESVELLDRLEDIDDWASWQRYVEKKKIAKPT